MEKRNLPVAVFDSGVGGISVLREMVRLMPEENFYFFGDSVHAPYGTKRPEEIRRLTLENVSRMERRGVKAIVVACNTATSAAIGALRERYTDIPVVGIEPALKPAVMEKEHPRVLVMATPMTVKASKFRNLMARFEGRAEVIPLGCPGLMEFVEAGMLEGPKLEQYLRELLGPCLTQPEGVDAIVLGCTHYPFVKRAIARVAEELMAARAGKEEQEGTALQTGRAGRGMPLPHILDGSEGTARELKRRLEQNGLLTDRKEPGSVLFEESIPEKIPLCRFLLEQDREKTGSNA